MAHNQVIKLVIIGKIMCSIYKKQKKKKCGAQDEKM